jgi:hypothetical protein
MADGRRRKMQLLRRPADVPLLKDDLKQHEEVEIDPGKINFIQHNPEIISLDSSWAKWDLSGTAGVAGHAKEEDTEMLQSNRWMGLVLKAALAMPLSASAASEPMSASTEQEIADLVMKTETRASAFMRGDMARWSGMTRIAEDFTLMQPFGGEASRGFKNSPSGWRNSQATFGMVTRKSNSSSPMRQAIWPSLS